jgi:hypothetical protein
LGHYRILDERAKQLIADYNRMPLCAKRYNPAAEQVYQARRRFGDPLLCEFEPYIVTGLKRFDMGRTMAVDFPNRLRNSLRVVRMRPLIGKFRECRLSAVDLSAFGSEIEAIYECLAPAGTLHPENQSHVAATKILHWLFPDLFLMLDSRVAGVFRDVFGVRFVKSTQPGYSAEKYLQCLQLAQDDIRSFGVERFRSLEVNTPEARIFDKIAWAAAP